MLANTRDGDMAEYLAQFMLSNLGSSILTPRPEDHGFDFHCTINSAKRGQAPDFRDSFYLQTKLGSPKDIDVGGRKKANSPWRRDRVNRVLNMDIPLLMGFVNIERHEVIIYQTSARWLLYYRLITQLRPFKIVFRPSTSISEPTSTKARGVNPTREHDGRRWVVDLGPPLLRIRLRDLRKAPVLARIKQTLSDYIEMERVNAAHRIFSTQWALWICRPPRGATPFRKAWVMEEKLFSNRDAAFYREMGMALVSLILRLHTRNLRKALKEASAIYRRLESRFTISKGIRDIVAKILI